MKQSEVNKFLNTMAANADDRQVMRCAFAKALLDCLEAMKRADEQNMHLDMLTKDIRVSITADLIHAVRLALGVVSAVNEQVERDARKAIQDQIKQHFN